MPRAALAALVLGWAVAWSGGLAGAVPVKVPKLGSPAGAGAAAQVGKVRGGGAAPQGRRVFAWYWHQDDDDPALTLQQIGSGLVDGIALGDVAWVGLAEDARGVRQAVLNFNATVWERYADVVKAARARGVEVHVVVYALPSMGASCSTTDFEVLDPTSPGFSIDMLVASSAAASDKYGLGGFSVDDEGASGPPRVNGTEARMWFQFVDMWADGLHAKGLTLSAATSATAAIQLPPDELRALFARSSVDAWISMDTYSSVLPYWYDNLDWYTDMVPPGSYAAGLMPDPGRNQSALPRGVATAQVFALHERGVRQAWVFHLPFGNPFYGPLLRKWRCGCGGCVVGTCWEDACSPDKACQVAGHG